jgi:hypothetical protein
MRIADAKSAPVPVFSRILTFLTVILRPRLRGPGDPYENTEGPEETPGLFVWGGNRPEMQ